MSDELRKKLEVVVEWRVDEFTNVRAGESQPISAVIKINRKRYPKTRGMRICKDTIQQAICEAVENLWEEL